MDRARLDERVQLSQDVGSESPDNALLFVENTHCQPQPGCSVLTGHRMSWSRGASHPSNSEFVISSMSRQTSHQGPVRHIIRMS